MTYFLKLIAKIRQVSTKKVTEFNIVISHIVLDFFEISTRIMPAEKKNCFHDIHYAS